jgi:hypothetical protein
LWGTDTGARGTSRFDLADVLSGEVAGCSLRGMFESFDRPVRCSAGHLYTSIWIPLASLKALRMGTYRIQRCPVGHHWAKTYSLDPATLTDEQRAQAASVHDLRIP